MRMFIKQLRCYKTKQNPYLNREALELGGLGLQV